MAKVNDAFPRESAGPNFHSSTKVVLTLAAGGADIKGGAVVGRKADGTYASAGLGGVTAPYFVTVKPVTGGASAVQFEARLGRFLFPNNGFYTVAKLMKEVDFTGDDACTALLVGSKTFLVGYDAKSDSLIVSVGEQL